MTIEERLENFHETPRGASPNFKPGFIFPSYKYARGVGLNAKERCELRNICSINEDQILRCYKYIDEKQGVSRHDLIMMCNGCKYRGIASNELGTDTVDGHLRDVWQPDWLEEFMERYNYKYQEEFDGNPKSYVYFITDGRYIKIGKANNVRKRLSSLRVSNPLPLKVMFLIPFSSEENAFSIEQVLHLKFNKYQMQGEWFDIYNKLQIPRWELFYGRSTSNEEITYEEETA